MLFNKTAEVDKGKKSLTTASRVGKNPEITKETEEKKTGLATAAITVKTPDEILFFKN